MDDITKTKCPVFERTPLTATGGPGPAGPPGSASELPVVPIRWAEAFRLRPKEFKSLGPQRPLIKDLHALMTGFRRSGGPADFGH